MPIFRTQRRTLEKVIGPKGRQTFETLHAEHTQTFGHSKAKAAAPVARIAAEAVATRRNGRQFAGDIRKIHSFDHRANMIVEKTRSLRHAAPARKE